MVYHKSCDVTSKAIVYVHALIEKKLCYSTFGTMQGSPADGLYVVIKFKIIGGKTGKSCCDVSPYLNYLYLFALIE